MKKKITLTLKENGYHSLEKGLTVFKDFEQNEDEFLLKEAIMFLHHGIELLMKQALVENGGEFLIFSDIDNDTVKKVIQAKKDNKSVFKLDKPVHTATYQQVIERVDAFVNSHTLPENLKTWLTELNKLRNQIEHYAIEEEIDKIKNLIVKIRKPLLLFFDMTIKDFKAVESKKVNQNWELVSEQIEIEKKIIEKSTKENLVIVCEGQTDGQILKILIDKVITEYKLNKTYSIIIANGLPYFSKTIRNMMAHSIGDKVIIVTDGDGKIEEREKQLLSIGVPIESQIIIEPEIEVWLFDNYKQDRIPRKHFKDKQTLAKLATETNIESLAQKDQAFNKLIDILKK